MTSDTQMADGSNFKDRRAGLIVFGTLEILLGLLFLLMVPLMVVGMLVSARVDTGSVEPMSARMMIPAILFYVLLAVWFIWMGIGSIMARRWARALWLVTSWFWLVCGITGLVFMVVVMPGMYDQMSKSGQMPQAMVAVVRYVTLGFMTLFYIILPGALVLFYGSRHVKATCERRDPQVRWTDQCPLPVLAVSLMAGCWAACMPFMGFYGWALPFFGLILKGALGAGVALATMLLLGYVAWGAYHLRIKAWWCAALLTAGWGMSACITFSRVSLMEFYERMELPEQQLAAMRQFALPQDSWMALFSGLWVAALLGYLLYVRRYFEAPSGPQGT